MGAGLHKSAVTGIETKAREESDGGRSSSKTFAVHPKRFGGHKFVVVRQSSRNGRGYEQVWKEQPLEGAGAERCQDMPDAPVHALVFFPIFGFVIELSCRIDSSSPFQSAVVHPVDLIYSVSCTSFLPRDVMFAAVAG